MFPDLMENIPNIYFGASLRLLCGFISLETADYTGSFDAQDEGMNLYQEIIIRSGQIGFGFKMALGFSSEVYEIDENHNISVGLTFDNIFGQISWSKDLEETHYIIESEEKFLNQLDRDFYDEHERSYSISSFTSTLPFNVKMGVLYRFNDFSFSLDYSQNFGSSHAYFYSPEVTMGAEYVIAGWLPLQLGMRLPNKDSHAKYSLGAGLRFDRFECGFGYKGVGSLFGDKTKGLAVSTYMKFRF
jgi:hypothetical protein